jgi:hypothetical protein
MARHSTSVDLFAPIAVRSSSATRDDQPLGVQLSVRLADLAGAGFERREDFQSPPEHVGI